jgi:cell division protease FtsH
MDEKNKIKSNKEEKKSIKSTSKEKATYAIDRTKLIFHGAKSRKKPWFRNPLILVLLFFIISIIFVRLFFWDDSQKVDYGTLIDRIQHEDFKRVDIDGQTVRITPKNESEQVIVGIIPNSSDFQADLREVGVNPETKEIYFAPRSSFDILSIISIVLMLAFIGIIAYSIFSAKSIASGGPMMSFGDTKAKLFTGQKQDVKFDQIQGADEAVEDVKEIVSFLKQPEKYIKLGARIPKGVLLIGSPGTGKTLLARAIAGEAGVPFFFTSGSEFEEMLVGAGASRVRDLFSKAKKASPAIIFIDEIDSIARKRGTVINSGNTEQTLNQILVEMDGFDKNTNVIVIAATNRPDVLDPAILRPGRFDRRITLELPDLKGREQILKVHASNKPLAADVNLENVAKRTIGFSGADLENTLNEAALIAVKAGRKEITSADIEEAATKVTIGPAKKRVKSEKMKKLTAYHEAGHAIAGYFMKDADKVHRISIVSRGYTGGVTMYLPEEDENELKTDKKFYADLVTLFGGRTAEKLKLDSISTGASSDIQRATLIARNMVKKYGMSSLGYVDLETEEDGYVTKNPYSEKTAEQIDNEVNRILLEAQKESERILSENSEKLDKLAEMLVEKEVIEGDEFYAFMEGKNIETEKV